MWEYDFPCRVDFGDRVGRHEAVLQIDYNMSDTIKI
jgi:hypothetical protein